MAPWFCGWRGLEERLHLRLLKYKLLQKIDEKYVSKLVLTLACLLKLQILIAHENQVG